MSRGLGVRERFILSLLVDRGGERLAVDEIRWNINGHQVPLPSVTRRAIRSLHRKQLVDVSVPTVEIRHYADWATFGKQGRMLEVRARLPLRPLTPGWYPCEGRSGWERYWTGSEWGHLRRSPDPLALKAT